MKQLPLIRHFIFLCVVMNTLAPAQVHAGNVFRLCFFSMNTEYERIATDAYLAKVTKDTDLKVEVKEYVSESGNPEEAFQKLLDSGEVCHGLVFSGHHTGSFYGRRSNGKLSLDLLEKNSCETKYENFFSNVRSVWLNGCNTLGNNIEVISSRMADASRRAQNLARHRQEDGIEATELELQEELGMVLDPGNTLQKRYQKLFPNSQIFGWTNSAPSRNNNGEHILNFHIANVAKLLDRDKKTVSNPKDLCDGKEACKNEEKDQLLKSLQALLSPKLNESDSCTEAGVNGWVEAGNVKLSNGNWQDGKYGLNNPGAQSSFPLLSRPNPELIKSKRLACELKKPLSCGDVASLVDELMGNTAWIQYGLGVIVKKNQEWELSLNSEDQKLSECFEKAILKDQARSKALKEKLESFMASESSGLLSKLEYLNFYQDYFGKASPQIQKKIQTDLEEALAKMNDRDRGSFLVLASKNRIGDLAFWKKQITSLKPEGLYQLANDPATGKNSHLLETVSKDLKLLSQLRDLVTPDRTVEYCDALRENSAERENFVKDSINYLVKWGSIERAQLLLKSQKNTKPCQQSIFKLFQSKQGVNQTSGDAQLLAKSKTLESALDAAKTCAKSDWEDALSAFPFQYFPLIADEFFKLHPADKNAEERFFKKVFEAFTFANVHSRIWYEAEHPDRKNSLNFFRKIILQVPKITDQNKKDQVYFVLLSMHSFSWDTLVEEKANRAFFKDWIESNSPYRLRGNHLNKAPSWLKGDVDHNFKNLGYVFWSGLLLEKKDDPVLRRRLLEQSLKETAYDRRIRYLWAAVTDSDHAEKTIPVIKSFQERDQFVKDLKPSDDWVKPSLFHFVMPEVPEANESAVKTKDWQLRYLRLTAVNLENFWNRLPTTSIEDLSEIASWPMSDDQAKRFVKLTLLRLNENPELLNSNVVLSNDVLPKLVLTHLKCEDFKQLKPALQKEFITKANGLRITTADVDRCFAEEFHKIDFGNNGAFSKLSLASWLVHQLASQPELRSKVLKSVSSVELRRDAIKYEGYCFYDNQYFFDLIEAAHPATKDQWSQLLKADETRSAYNLLQTVQRKLAADPSLQWLKPEDRDLVALNLEYNGNLDWFVLINLASRSRLSDETTVRNLLVPSRNIVGLSAWTDLTVRLSSDSNLKVIASKTEWYPETKEYLMKKAQSLGLNRKERKEFFRFIRSLPERKDKESSQTKE